MGIKSLLKPQTFNGNGEYENLVQNLKDTGCKAEQVKQFPALRDAGVIKGQMKLLRGQRD